MYFLFSYPATGSPPQENLFLLPAFVARKMTPWSRKSGYGLLLGCRSELDVGRENDSFLALFKKVIGQNPGNLHLTVAPGIAIDQAPVELVGREPLMFAKVENGVTKSCRIFRLKNRKNANLA